MTTGRTVNKYTRVYVNGYDLSGYARTIGPLDWSFEVGTDNPMNASIVGNWVGQATISPGTLNALFDTTATTGLHALAKSTAGTMRNVMVAVGIQKAPAEDLYWGNPVYCGQFQQNDYLTGPGDTPNSATIKYSPVSSTATSLVYAKPWGILLHANEAETTDNAADGFLNNEQVATTDGGWMMYQVTTAAGAGDITATIKIQDSANAAGPYADLLSTGSINLGAAGVAVPTSGVVALAPTATVNMYTRWQLAWGTATSVTFALAFMRNYHT